MNVLNGSKLENEVEVDETFVGEENNNRHKDKKVERCQGRSFKDKVPVFGILQRDGQLIAMNTNSIENAWSHLKRTITGTYYISVKTYRNTLMSLLSDSLQKDMQIINDLTYVYTILRS